MTVFMKALVGVSSAALLAVGAQAQTIDFDGLPGNNGDSFNGPYLEDGFSIARTAGEVFEGHVFGNPDPSLVVGSVFGGGNSGTIEATRGATFSLASFDLSAQNGNAGYTVEGYLGAALVYSFGGSAGGGFSTYAGNAGVVDRVRFILQPTGTSVNIDNLVFRDARVPEPGTWALLIAGFGLAGSAVRRRQVVFALA
jgi:hypothetical protein